MLRYSLSFGSCRWSSAGHEGVPPPSIHVRVNGLSPLLGFAVSTPAAECRTRRSKQHGGSRLEPRADGAGLWSNLVAPGYCKDLLIFFVLRWRAEGVVPPRVVVWEKLQQTHLSSCMAGLLAAAVVRALLQPAYRLSRVTSFSPAPIVREEFQPARRRIRVAGLP